ncbi:unnamed protein product [Urochloa humidicola]
MGDLTIKRTLEVPACRTPDGTGLLLCPCFHRSPAFVAGGYEWFICYYPNSLYHDDGIDLCLQLQSSHGAMVKISSGVNLLNPTASLPPLQLVMPSPPLRFDSDDDDRRMVTHWVPKSLLSEHPAQKYLHSRGSFMFEWTITVLPETPAPMSMPLPMPKLQAKDVTPLAIPMPMSMLQLGAMPNIPATATTAMEPPPKPKVPAPDVTFSVEGELFQAHKVILTMRSPVFKAQLSGAALATMKAAIKVVDDMQPDVFEALLSYIYTDALPATEGQDDEDVCQLMCHLLVAATRYRVLQLKNLCEERLSKMVGVDNVADMLAFAGDQRCDVLQNACIEFILSSGRRMGDVVASKGYQRLRKEHPLILVDVLEKSLLSLNAFPATEIFTPCAELLI